MKKFYTFTAGSKVPCWIMDFTCSDIDMHKNKSGKITFARSVVAVREGGKLTKLIPAANGDCYVHINGFTGAAIGSQNGASGVEIRNDNLLSDFGKGLTYVL